MRILFFIDSLVAGGKERRLLQLMKGLKLNNDFEFMLVIMSSEIHYVEVHDLNIPIHYLIRDTKKDISVFKKFYDICKNFKPDIVHCWDSMTAVYLVPACKMLKIKIVNGMVVDTPVQRNILNKDWLRAQLTFPFSDVVVGNSNAGLQAYNAPKQRSECIYNGMDLSRFESLKTRSEMHTEIFGDFVDDKFIVGMVAAFGIRKDYKTLVKAAIILAQSFPNVRFVLVGDGSEFQSVKASVPASLQNTVIFLGKRSDVESIINIFDVGILLTNSKVHGEGISNSIIEYMALGKPVIATSGGGTNEVVSDNRNGFLIDPENADQLVEKIILLMEDRTLTKSLGSEGKKLARERFDYNIMTKNYIALYNKLLEI